MLIAVLVYAGLYTLSRKTLPWIARRHPGGRNVAAFVVESLAAIGAANAIFLVVSPWYSSLRPDAPALNALLSGTFALGMHYLASDVATAGLPLYLPFVLSSLLFMVLRRPISHTVGFGMLLMGAAVTVLKYRDLRRSGPPVVGQAPRA